STPPPSFGIACGANVPSTPTMSRFCCACALETVRAAAQHAATMSLLMSGLPKRCGAFYTHEMRSLFALLLVGISSGIHAQPLPTHHMPIFDAHLHYSHDAWELVPVPQAIEILRKAGLKRALISSAGDDGQQRLYQAAPDLV